MGLVAEEAGALDAAGAVLAAAAGVADIAGDVPVCAGAGSGAAVAVSGGMGGAGGGTLSAPPHAKEKAIEHQRAIRMAACTRQMR
ncbi:MAG TPA: hypothetical protein VGH28_08010 [Polyangiaceae bacterium]